MRLVCSGEDKNKFGGGGYEFFFSLLLVSESALQLFDGQNKKSIFFRSWWVRTLCPFYRIYATARMCWDRPNVLIVIPENEI